ncbi:hypothetical protein BU15DRAFT_76387 [Melanogaster broomeanus]|nr:hypothetical protein BU15DRAFT_76387 [Melanogaster broomeanus]
MSRPPVPLPSIRDIFPGGWSLPGSNLPSLTGVIPGPEMSMQGNSLHPNSTTVGATANVPVSSTIPFSRLNDSFVVHLPQPVPISPPCTRDDKRTRETHSKHFHLSQAPPSPPPSSSSSESAVHRPTRFHPQRISPPLNPPSYSFNVLRADPVTSSLEHVASSTTLRNRGSAAAHPSSQAGIANGSAPVFRVAMTPMDSCSPHHHHHRGLQNVMPDSRERHGARDILCPAIARESDLTHLRSPNPSTILSFSVSDPPSSAPTLMTNDGRRLHRSELLGTPLQGEGRGKKHQCPHCGKRFNRPSSMKIHVNTHTGAKPYRCPFPGCGREFNVNSNMRRHWRNHSRSAPVRLADGDGRAMYNPRSGPTDVLGPHHALMSPPATNSSMSEGNSDDGNFSDEEGSHYAMDIDECDEDGKEDAADDVNHPIVSTRSSSSDLSAWSRSTSPARGAAPPTYGHGHQDNHHQPYIRHTSSLSHTGLSSPPSHMPTSTSDYIYRPSIPAYAISCTDSRVSTALRPAFTTSSRESHGHPRSYNRDKRRRS